MLSLLRDRLEYFGEEVPFSCPSLVQALLLHPQDVRTLSGSLGIPQLVPPQSSNLGLFTSPELSLHPGPLD